ncbi:hypothetical protein KHQ81_02210 [Mycoplasmatota bacterium]|nr:hypothetical protein KHQ81_02210 [Mycoplasmatota bacterium]
MYYTFDYNSILDEVNNNEYIDSVILDDCLNAFVIHFDSDLIRLVSLDGVNDMYEILPHKQTEELEERIVFMLKHLEKYFIEQQTQVMSTY